MKILFLDIDGVLVTLRHSAAIGETGLLTSFDPINVALVNRICKVTDAKIVVISSWRYAASEALFTRKYPECRDLKEYLIFEGIKANHFHSNWQAPFKISSTKSQDIMFWMRDNSEPSQFVVLDDNNIFREDSMYFNKHIKTTWEDGISYNNYISAISVLGRKNVSLLSKEDIKTEESMF